MSDARERAQEWLKFHDMQIDDLHQLVGGLLAALSDAEREIIECKSAERMLMDALEKAERERDEAIAERDRYKSALEKIEAMQSPCGDARRLEKIAREALGGGA